MKTAIIFTLYLFLTSLINAQENGNLTITFDDFEAPQGEIYIAVYEKNNFLRQPTKSTMLKVKAENNQARINDLPFGEYAISVFQDLNTNQRLDMTENQMPAEPWAMSGNVNPMQRPTFEAAKFEFNSNSNEVKLKLIQ